MAAGRPIIAYGMGGAAETVIPGRTGVFIEAQTWEDIGDAVIRHKPADYDPKSIRAHAENFSFNSFQEKIIKCVARHTNITSDEPALIGDMYAQYFD
jgi:glycosyltransferase involved in cell wall biosynthesis